MMRTRQRTITARALAWLAVVVAFVLPVPQHSHIDGLAGSGNGAPAVERAHTSPAHHAPGQCLACATGPRTTVAPTVVVDLASGTLCFAVVPVTATPRPAAVPRDGAARGPPSFSDIA